MIIDRRTLLKGVLTAGTVAVARTVKADEETREAGPDDVGMLYDSTMCIGCKACVVKCKEVNNLPADIDAMGNLYDAPEGLDHKTKNVIKLAVVGGHSAFMKQQCMHCVDSSCVSACMMAALHREPNGVVAYDEELCVGCRYCQIVCPFGVPAFDFHAAAPKLQKCELCRDRLKEGKLPGCVEVCPRHAVIYGKRTELLAEAHARIEREPDRYQHKVYGEFDGGGTHVLYLSSVPFKELGLPELGTESPAHKTNKIQDTIYKGFIAPIALYAGLAFAMFRNRTKEVAASTVEPGQGGGDK